MEINEITERIIGCAIDVHAAFGPGLLESAYEKCLAHDLGAMGFLVERQVTVPLVYKGLEIDAGYRLDLQVNRMVIVEIKCVEKILPIHQAQLLSYLKLTGVRVGLIINFHVYRLTDGVRRLIN